MFRFLLLNVLFTFIFLNFVHASEKPIYAKIAHAGGAFKAGIGFKKETYTNSLDALNVNKHYTNLFEIDFRFTSDNHLVCIHDWDNGARNNFFLKFIPKRPSLKTFEDYVDKNIKYKNCTIYTLIDWLIENPDTYIITDIKEKNLEGLKFIASNYPYLVHRFIPQIYEPEKEYELVKAMGYQNIIWTLYKNASYVTEEILRKNIPNMNLYAITIPVMYAERNMASTIKKIDKNLFVYTHTINDNEKFMTLRKTGVDGVYTDFLY